jgi:YidC/Oxa1 family membrane protein insertase
MDKNTIIGFILIFVVLIGFSYLNQPSKEQLEARQKYQDSIATVQQAQAEQQAVVVPLQKEELVPENHSDSLYQNQLQDKFGDFASASQGTEEFITIENELMILKLTTKGGRVYSVQLKNYTNAKNDPLVLFDGNEANFSTTLVTNNNRIINTSDLFFEISKTDSAGATLRLKAGEEASLDFVYVLHDNDYMVDFSIVPHNLQNHISAQTGIMDILWQQKIRQQEGGRKFEERYARMSYKYLSDEMEELRETKDDAKNIANKLKWVAFKDQFFSSVLIAQESFEASQLESKYFQTGDYLKDYTATTGVEFDPKSEKTIALNFYFGPNDYNLLRNYDKTKFEGHNLGLEKLVPLGWSLFRYVNKWIIIPIFDWLTSWVGSIGLAIFLLTLIIKFALFPLVYKSFMSSAKMRVMKPQIEEITAKHPGQENAVVRQQKTMELYRQVGINPMSGCFPMLLQMPFLISLFWFFPAAIELRHQSFLWAHDLATYDDLIHWSGNIPLISNFLGNHISLFCVLMTVTNLIYTKYNMDQTNAGQEQMPGMKLMMYIMPGIMFFIFNSYPAGLNYYYFISTLIAVLQTILFRYFLDEKALLAKLEANKKKPVKKKSGFMARLEEAQKKQQAMLKEQQRQKGGKGKR